MASPTPTDASARIAVILNKGSGARSADETAEEIKAALTARGADFRIHVVTPGDSIGEMVKEVVDGGAEIVVAAGGDGTICGVAEALLETEATLGVIPLGTFNFFARTLNISDEIEEAAKVVADGVMRRVSVGQINERLFLNNASIGVYPAILHRREVVYKRWWRSQLLAHISAMRTLLRFRSPLSVRMTANGETTETRTSLIFVACNEFQLEKFDLDGADEVRRDRLAILQVKGGSRFALIRGALALALGIAREGRDFHLIGAEEIVIETKAKTRLVARDGEPSRMKGPFRFVMRERALKVMCPAEKPIERTAA